jgi:hypothetical protein
VFCKRFFFGFYWAGFFYCQPCKTVSDKYRHNPAFIGGLRCQAIQTENGPYTAERTQKAFYIVRRLFADGTKTVSDKYRHLSANEDNFFTS